MDQQQMKLLIASVVGVGVVLGTAGRYLYQQIYGEHRRLLHQQSEIRRLDKTVSELKAELLELQKRERKKKARRRGIKGNVTSDTESEFDMYSAVGTTDDEDDEFFDLSDDENIINDIPNLDIPDDPVLAQLFSTVDMLMNGPVEDKCVAYRQLLDHLEVYPECSSLLWRLAKSCHCMATVHQLENDMEKKKEVVMQGVSYAKRAIDLDGTSSEAHKWYAVLIGTRGEFFGMKEKIQDGYIFKSHVDKALELSPSDASLYHLLGRFKFEVASLSWIERRLASTLFAEPPSSTFEEAISDFSQVERLNLFAWKENRLFLAKCHIGVGDYSAAITWLDKTIQLDIKSPEDEVVHGEAVKLAKQYSGYR